MNAPSRAHGPPAVARGSSSIFNDMVKAIKQNGFSLPSNSAFLFMSAFFTYWMWMVMGSNGAADALQETMANNEYAGGIPLLASYTGIGKIDKLFQMIVAFEFPMTQGLDKSAWLLMLEIMTTLQTAIIWIFMDSMRKGRSSAWLAYPTAFCYATNAIGAAVVLPIYFWLQLRYRPTEEYIQLWNAAPLPNAFLVGAVVPGLVLMSATVVPRDIVTQQQIVAVVQLCPALIATLQIVCSSLYPIRDLDIRRRRIAALPALQKVLRYGTIFCAAAHLYIVGSIIFGSASLSSVFIPSGAAVVSASPSTKILEAARNFLQWDMIGITTATGLWCYHLVSELSPHMSGLSIALRLASSMVVFGPGATTSAVLSWRESVNVEKAESKRRARLV